MCIDLGKFADEAMECVQTNKIEFDLSNIVINEKLSLLIESNPPFGLDYEEVNKNIHLLANPPFGVNSYDYKG